MVFSMPETAPLRGEAKQAHLRQRSATAPEKEWNRRKKPIKKNQLLFTPILRHSNTPEPKWELLYQQTGSWQQIGHDDIIFRWMVGCMRSMKAKRIVDALPYPRRQEKGVYLK